MLYVSYHSFQQNLFSVLNFGGWFGVLSNKFIVFDIPLLCYYVNLRSSIIFCLFSGDMYSFISLICSSPFVTVSKLFFGEVFETFVILAVVLLPIRSWVNSAVFWIAIFEAILCGSVANCLARSRSFRRYFGQNSASFFIF